MSVYGKITKICVWSLIVVGVRTRSSAQGVLGTWYLTLLVEADLSKRQIRKTRYCLTFEGQYFEIDVYPFWNDKAIAEIELSDENAEIVFPKQIKVIKEVTDDDS